MICIILNSELKLDAPGDFSLHLSHFLHQPSELAEIVSNKMEVFSIQQVEWNVSQVNLRQTSFSVFTPFCKWPNKKLIESEFPKKCWAMDSHMIPI